MKVSIKPDVQAKLDQMARESGRPSDELVEDALVGYFDEVAHTRDMLDRRFNELVNGKGNLIAGEEAFRRLIDKTDALRHRQAWQGYEPLSEPRP